MALTGLRGAEKTVLMETLKPIEDRKCPIMPTAMPKKNIESISMGYPYFIQFICREACDAFIQNVTGQDISGIPSFYCVEQATDVWKDLSCTMKE